jgi:beta-glucosidase
MVRLRITHVKLNIAVLAIILITNAASFAQIKVESTPIYKNPNLSIESRVADLVSRMTIEEKVGQISALLGWEMYQKNGEQVSQRASFEKAIKEQHTGMLWATLRADPWTRKTLITGLNPRQAAEATNALQKYAIENSRLGIPILFAEECMHGHMAIGTTVFPTAIGQGSTWNPDLIEEMASVIARETRLQGAHIGYGPILDMAREPRWSRVEETFGEDPYLIAEMGKAVVKGFQGNNLNSGVNVASTLKHFAAYGVSEGGQNGGSSTIGERELFQSYLPPFKAAIKAGATSVMTAYNSLDGIPCTSNSFLLTDVLRKQWGYKGFLVSDLGSIEGIYYTHHVTDSPAGAAALAIKAGMDADLGGKGFGEALISAVKMGLVSIDELNGAVSKVLKLKFEMGLFENPFVNPQKAEKEVRNQGHIELARQVARESAILLKNNNKLLPLDKNIKSIAILGPNADNLYNQLGDYTAPQAESNVITVLKGIKNKVTSATKVQYVKGCAIRDTASNDIVAAVEAARHAQVAIVVLGGSSARDFKTSYENTGAANVAKNKSEDQISDMESGEGFDRSSLDLMGKQLTLLQEVVKTGTPVILVLIEGRPLNLNWPSANVDAIIDMWYPGQEGGNALADILFGDYNPAGRLPVSIPRSIGQLPVYYNYKSPLKHSYVEGEATPLFPFGYGLSYSQFEYKDLQLLVSENKDSLKVHVECNLKNTGTCDGDEVLQLYLHEKTGSVVLPVKQLKRFKRIPLRAGEEKRVTFDLYSEDLMLWNSNHKWVVEPGEFEVMVGGSSDDIPLNGIFKIEQLRNCEDI